MGSLNELLRQAHAAGLRLTVNGDKLRITGPNACLPVTTELLARKAEVIAALERGLCDCGAAADIWRTSDGKARCERCLWRVRTKYLQARLAGRDLPPFWAACVICGQGEANCMTDDHRQLCSGCWDTATGRAFARGEVA